MNRCKECGKEFILDEFSEVDVCSECFGEYYGYCDCCGNYFRYYNQMQSEKVNECVRCVPCKIEELKEQLTDVINESESDNISLKRREELDSLYFELDSKINQLSVKARQ